MNKKLKSKFSINKLIRIHGHCKCDSLHEAWLTYDHKNSLYLLTNNK